MTRLVVPATRVVALVILCGALAVAAPAFLTADNVINVLRQASLLVVLSAGLTLVVLTAGIDLSVAAVVALTATVAGGVMANDVAWPLACLAGIGVGAAAGALNGGLVALVGLPAFLATFGVLYVAQGLAQGAAGSQTYSGFPPAFLFLARGDILGVPVLILLAAAVAGSCALLANRTAFGRELYVIGANQVAARLSGVPVRRRLLVVYTLSGGLAGAAGLLFAARVDGASADISTDLLLPTLTVVVIGGTSLFGGEGGIGGTVLGALLTAVLLNGMNLLDISSSLQLAAMGVLVVAAVLIDGATSRLRVARPSQLSTVPSAPTR